MIRLILGFLVCIILGSTMFLTVSAAEDNQFILIPKAKDEYGPNKVDKLTNPNTAEGKKFWNAYNKFGDEYMAKKDKDAQCDLGSMLSSGIVTWDTILCLLIRVVKFIANMALIVGSAMIIYAGYLYTISALTGTSVDKTSEANDAVKNAAIGIVIVVFSYAIQRIVTQAFLS